MTDRLTPEIASRFAAIALGHVAREYPGVVLHGVEGPGDLLAPHMLHPVFHGSFDWHSCVHGHWLLARLLRAWPALPQASAIAGRFDTAFTPDGISAEVAYMAARAGFERPYGWAWLLMLAAELSRGEARAVAWGEALRPLADLVAGRFRSFLPKADFPVRAGVHSNTAFALVLVLDYATTAGDTELASLVIDKARTWYEADAGCQAWEPSGDDFLSPSLVEAELMRRVLEPDAFKAWFARFLPDLADRRPATLFAPVRVSDRADGKIAHLDGLNLSRAWCWRGLAASLAPSDPVRALALEAAERHLAASLPQVAGDYMGEHWLASFAALALDDPAAAGPAR